MPQQIAAIYEFGPFILNTAEQSLLRQGEPVPITPKTYDILVLLLQNRGRMLTKSEMLQAVWPDSFVDESNLTQHISMIRKVLGETAGDARYIITVPGRGYRFAGEVKEGVDEERAFVPEEPGKLAPVVPPGRPWWLKRNVALLLAAFVFGSGALGLVLFSRSARRSSSPMQRTLAILPFQS